MIERLPDPSLGSMKKRIFLLLLIVALLALALPGFAVRAVKVAF